MLKFKEEGKVGVVVSDFSSHGVSAALAASMPKIIIDMLGLDKRSPSKLLMHINGRIKGLIGRHFLAAFHRIYDPCQQTLCFAQ
jgi:serine phosphatase RsbU (regulator of sigma subunit)